MDSHLLYFTLGTQTAHGGNEHGKSSWRQATAGRRLGRHSDSKSVCMRGRSWQAFRKRWPCVHLAPVMIRTISEQ